MDKTQYVLNSVNDFGSKKNTIDILGMPSRLPMICKPIPCSKHVKNGYLLNDKNYGEPLLIEKHSYGSKSTLVKKKNTIVIKKNTVVSYIKTH